MDQVPASFRAVLELSTVQIYDAVSLGSPEARGGFRFTHDAILGVGSIHIVF